HFRADLARRRPFGRDDRRDSERFALIEKIPHLMIDRIPLRRFDFIGIVTCSGSGHKYLLELLLTPPSAAAFSPMRPGCSDYSRTKTDRDTAAPPACLCRAARNSRSRAEDSAIKSYSSAV